MCTSSATSSPWARVFAALYDPVSARGERLGMTALRRALLEQARGRTLELGAGTGLNLAHYPSDLDELTLAEPEPAMRERLRRRLHKSPTVSRVIDAHAERLPCEDSSLDTVVSTLVLCTVDEPEAALSEVARVLAPGGRLLFIEHVRSHSERTARWQDRLEPVWRSVAVGCRCNRATLETMRRCGYEVHAREARWRAAPPFVARLMVGSATSARPIRALR